MPRRHTRYFTIYAADRGDSLRMEARARNMTLTGMVRAACNDWLTRNPAPIANFPAGDRGQPNQFTDR